MFVHFLFIEHLPFTRLGNWLMSYIFLLWEVSAEGYYDMNVRSFDIVSYVLESWFIFKKISLFSILQIEQCSLIYLSNYSLFHQFSILPFDPSSKLFVKFEVFIFQILKFHLVIFHSFHFSTENLMSFHHFKVVYVLLLSHPKSYWN